MILKNNKYDMPILNFILYILGPLFLNMLLKPLIKTDSFFIKILPTLLIWMLILIINFKEIKKDFKKIKINFKKNINLAFKYYFWGLMLMIATNLIINMFLHQMPINEIQNRNMVNLHPIYSSILMILIAPLIEEIVFRVSFKKAIKNKQLFLIITAFIFGLIHVIFNGDFIYIIPYMALGYFLAKIYIETTNMFYSYFMHAFHNLICILLILIRGIL